MTDLAGAASGRLAEQRRAALVLLVLGGVGFAVVGLLWVPWHWLPDGRALAQVSPGEVFSAKQIERATSYSSAQRHLWVPAYVVSLVIAGLLGFTRLGARVVELLPGWWWVRLVLGSFVLLLVGEVLTLPFSLLERRNSLAAGLTHQSLAGWLQDDLLSLLVTTLYTAIAAVLLIGLAWRLPRSWPVWAGALSGLLVVLGSFVYPVLVEPLFNSFAPLPAGPLRTSIMHLAKVENVHLDDVLVADASRRTTTLNAYVTGFGSTRRVVLYDNLLKDLSQPEVDAVVAHELGHAKDDDVLLGTVLGAFGAAFGVGLLALVLSRPGLLRRAGASGPGDPRVLALLMALTAAATLLAAPVENAASRAVEARADRTSLLATRDPADFEQMQKQLASTSLQEPVPPGWEQLWFGTHPTTLQRIGMARAMSAQLDAPRVGRDLGAAR
ncbi:MAG: M48 family metallopeptidase [Marmoricola sp.]